MGFLDFAQNSLVTNLIIFAVAGLFIWFVGTRISYFADLLSDRLNLGKAFVGLLFLALATDMPEIGTTVSASASGEAELAISNIFGGVVFQTLVLALADLIFVRGALTFFTPKPVLLLQGILLIILLAISLMAMAIGELGTVFGVGYWSIILLGVYLVSLFVSQRYEGHEAWHPDTDISAEERAEVTIFRAKKTPQDRYGSWSTRRLVAFFLLGTVAILIAGVLLANIGDALAVQTGLGASFVGAVLLAASTSLPELSTTFTAIRIGSFSLAFSNIFGSNSILLLLVFISDVFYREGSILDQATRGTIVSAAIGVIVTGIYLAGLIERRDRTVLRMGIDSALILILYVISVILTYGLRDTVSG